MLPAMFGSYTSMFMHQPSYFVNLLYWLLVPVLTMFLWPVFIKFRCQLYSDLVLQDLCRQRMAGSSAAAGEKRASSLADDDQISPLKSDLPSAGCAPGVSGGQADRLRSPRSSTSSWLVDMCQCVGVPATPPCLSGPAGYLQLLLTSLLALIMNGISCI